MKNKELTILISVLAILIIIAGGVLGYKIIQNKKNEKTEVSNPEVVEENKDETIVINKKQPKIFNGTDRPIAVMIDNHSGAWPQANLNKAYIVYEIVVEGGETRLMALFKGQDLEKIGPVRSSRHYFLDYALENDAIYVHHGQSPQAAADFSNLSVDRIVVDNNKTGWRDKGLNVSSEHTLFTSISKLNKGLGNKRQTRNKNLLLNYSVDEIDMANVSNAKTATNVSIKYSSAQTTSYTYDANNKYYLRSVNGKAHTDYVTKNQYHFKNIIVYQVGNYTINDGENKGRQNLENVGSGKGYYISNGYSIPINWSKASRSAQTKYTLENGEELKVNDGNTFIQIQPAGQALNIS